MIRKSFRISDEEDEILKAYSRALEKTENQVVRELIAKLKNKTALKEKKDKDPQNQKDKISELEEVVNSELEPHNRVEIEAEHLKRITPLQKKLLLSLLSGNTLKKACLDVNISLSLGRKFLDDCNFNVALELETKRLYDVCFVSITGLVEDSLDQLREMIRDPEVSYRDKLKAINIILSYSLKHHQKFNSKRADLYFDTLETKNLNNKNLLAFRSFL